MTTRRNFLASSAAVGGTALLGTHALANMAATSAASNPVSQGGPFTMPETLRVAAVQSEPVWFDLDGTVDKTVDLIAEAGANGAHVIGFPETWIPGYPSFMWFGDAAYRKTFIERYRAASITFGSPQHHRIEDAAREAGITVSLGVSEWDDGNLYMGTWVIDPNGETLVVRRKSKPSGREWDIFTSGPGTDVKVAQTPVGSVGTLSCNENLRPLMRAELYRQNMQIHVSAWPHFGLFPGWRAVSYVPAMDASAAIAREGECVVVAATQVASQAYIDGLQLPAGAESALAAGCGASRIFEPVTGKVIGGPADPAFDGLIYANVAGAAVYRKHDYDPAPMTVTDPKAPWADTGEALPLPSPKDLMRQG